MKTSSFDSTLSDCTDRCPCSTRAPEAADDAEVVGLSGDVVRPPEQLSDINVTDALSRVSVMMVLHLPVPGLLERPVYGDVQWLEDVRDMWRQGNDLHSVLTRLTYHVHAHVTRVVVHEQKKPPLWRGPHVPHEVLKPPQEQLSGDPSIIIHTPYGASRAPIQELRFQAVSAPKDEHWGTVSPAALTQQMAPFPLSPDATRPTRFAPLAATTFSPVTTGDSPVSSAIKCDVA